MSRVVILPAVFLSIALQLSPPVYPQAIDETKHASLDPANSLHIDANMVLVPVSVSDGMDRPVMGLQSESFSLYEDGQPQEIRYFSTDDAPISVALLLDLSKSMSDKFATERAAVSEFFKNANSQDDYVVISFSDRPKIIADSTQSINLIEKNLAAQTPKGDTALLDAVFFGESRMRSALYQRRSLLIISDGGDNHSRYRMRRIRKIIQDSDADVYAIGVFDTGPFKSLEEFMGKRWLAQITSAGGGETIAVESADKLPAAAAVVSREMRQRYVLGYLPDNNRRDSRRRQIVVAVKSPNSVKPIHAYYKSGYFPQNAK